MEKEDIKLLIELFIGGLLIVLAIKFIIKLLPLVVLLVIGLLIYSSYNKRKKNLVKEENVIKEAVIIDERNIE